MLLKFTNNKDTYIPNIQEKATYLNNINYFTR